MKQFFILIIILVFVQAIHAQVIHGQITDKETGEGLPFASVILLKDGIQKAGTSTDLDGNYTFEYTSQSKNEFYNIQVFYVGYKTRKITGINLKMVIEIEVNLEMIAPEIECGYGLTAYPIDRRFSPPLIDLQNTSTGQTLRASDSKRRF